MSGDDKTDIDGRRSRLGRKEFMSNDEKNNRKNSASSNNGDSGSGNNSNNVNNGSDLGFNQSERHQYDHGGI